MDSSTITVEPGPFTSLTKPLGSHKVHGSLDPPNRGRKLTSNLLCLLVDSGKPAPAQNGQYNGKRLSLEGSSTGLLRPEGRADAFQGQVLNLSVERRTFG
jgi:hypothetical protein